MKITANILAGLLLLLGTASIADASGIVDASSAADASAVSVTIDSDDDDAPGHTLVSIGHNQTLAAGEKADSVVSVMGNSIVAGDVDQDVVSVMGNSRITGAVGGDVVAVLGNTYIDSEVEGDVVAVLGKVELGPHAKVAGKVTGGSVNHDASGTTADDFDAVSSAMDGIDFAWLKNWVANCLTKGRLLAFAPGLGWAWAVALVSLAFYVLTAALMRASVQRYVRVLDEHPGESLIAAFIALLGTPVLLVLLCITVIGILAIPFLGIVLLAAASFGRVVMLAWIGQRLLRPAGNEAWLHPAATVLVGGLVVTALYVIPVVGMITFQLIGFVGMGVVAYALLLALRERRQANVVPPTVAPGVAPAPDVMQAVDAGPAAPGVVTAPAVSAAAYPRAGFWIRMFALFIDVLLVSLIVHLVLDSGNPQLVLLAAYGAIMWKLKGATLGGMICHLHVVRLDGRPLDWSTSIVRALACFLSMIVAGLGFIWIAIDGERQAWHDKIAGTVVVRVPTGVSLV